MNTNYQIIILAAGKGTRMESDLPKVLMPLGNSTMIEHLLDNLSLEPKPIVVVGYESGLVKNTLGEQVNYAYQTEQLGTGHAVMQASHLISVEAKTVVVLYGDQPFVDQVMIDKLLENHLASAGPITMGTIKVEDFDDWRGAFAKYGRITRDDAGNVTAIVEFKDTTDEQKQITEVNPAYFVFDADWLKNNLKSIDDDNNQHEYYLTDLIGIAFSEGYPIKTASINPKKGLGANTKKQLAVLEAILASQ